MANDGIRKASQPCEAELATQDIRRERRQRLAQRIGRMLADAWLKRQRESEKDETLGSNVSPERRAN